MMQIRRSALYALSIFFGVIFFATTVPASAQGVVEKALIRKQIEDLHQHRTPPTITKWTVPIRYKMVGLINPKDVELFHQVVARRGELSGLDIAEDASPDGRSVNLALIFVRRAEFVEVASLPNIKAALKFSQESDEQYRQRMNNSSKDGWLKQFHEDGNKIVYAANLVTTDLPRPVTMPGLLYSVIYSNLIYVGTANSVRPSIRNTDGTGYTDLSVFDVALLKAYYASEIPHHMPFAVALPILVDKVASALADGK
jgi:hypothetical protein